MWRHSEKSTRRENGKEIPLTETLHALPICPSFTFISTIVCSVVRLGDDGDGAKFENWSGCAASVEVI